MSTGSILRQAARTRNFTLGNPSAFTVCDDGATVLFLRSAASDDRVHRLWALDVRTGVERVLADPLTLVGDADQDLPPQELIHRERARITARGISSYAADPAARLVVFTLSGELWAVDSHGGTPRHIPTAGAVVDPRSDPTGTRIAYISGGSLHVIEGGGSRDRTLAAAEGPDVQYGLAEHVAAESMGRHRGFWWAPDGERLLVARVDNTPVQRWYISDPADPASEPRVIRYPAAGTTNAEVTLWILGVDGTRTPVEWDREAFEYVTSAGWDAHGPYVAVQSRNQQTLRALAIDPASGATSTLAEQRDDAWVSLIAGVPARTASGALVWTVDDGDTRRLSVDGKPVTPPGLQVHAVLGIDGDTVLLAATDEPTETHLWRFGPDGLARLTSEAGVHHGVSDGGTLACTSRTIEHYGPRFTVLRQAGPPLEVRSHAAEPALLPRMELRRAGQRGLHTALFLPSWYEPGTRLPVLMDPYAGPAGQKVLAHLGRGLMSQWFAEQGFAVVVVDGRGTPGRGPDWERTIYGDIAGPALEDQVDALADLGRQLPDLDLTRVGIRGWSYGGYLAALAVLRRPDVFHAAVAGAPPADQRLYDAHWRERFLGHPAQFPERYDRCSLIADAPNLTRPLLLIHGLADDNVVPAHSLRLSAALLAAGRAHEVVLLTGASHLVADPDITERIAEHELEFLQRTLL